MWLLDALLQRSLVVTLAIFGAALVMFGTYFKNRADADDGRLFRVLVRSGYMITWLSVALFIVAGFRSAYT